MASTQMLLVLSVVLLSFAVDLTQSHSWMTCPPSFNTNPLRGGHLTPTCEPNGNRAPVTTVQAGDRLKVGWTSNNHGGGYVRISLVPFNQHNSEVAAKNNVLKFACYGHDQRPGKTTFGDCIHPCNGRGGCFYQSEKNDVERFDTTIGIPTNLAPGDYVLQTAMLVGNGGTPYYSCGKLRILGGNTNLNCQSNEPPIVYSCFKSGGPQLQGNDLLTGAKRGNFCYHKDGNIGDVDDTIQQPPINIDCDPRLTCGNSVNRGVCEEARFMRDIVEISINPRQPRCPSGTTIDELDTETVLTLPPVMTTLPPEIQKVIDDVTNSATTETSNVPTATPLPIGLIDNPVVATLDGSSSIYSPVVQSGFIASISGIFNFEVSLMTPVPSGFCWQLDLQFRFPFRLNPNDPFNVWGDGRLVARNNRRTIIIESRRLGATTRVRTSFQAFSEDTNNIWDQQNMQYITAMFFVKPENECFNELLNGF